MTLSAVEFIRRFLLHVLPSQFVRIRHYGFLANCHRAEKLTRCRQLLGVATVQPPEEPSCDQAAKEPCDSDRCPMCGGLLRIIQQSPRLDGQRLMTLPWPWDSS
jgi:hypothetical protein